MRHVAELGNWVWGKRVLGDMARGDKVWVRDDMVRVVRDGKVRLLGMRVRPHKIRPQHNRHIHRRNRRLFAIDHRVKLHNMNR